MEEKKIWGSHIPMVGMEPGPLSIALRVGRAPAAFLRWEFAQGYLPGQEGA